MSMRCECVHTTRVLVLSSTHLWASLYSSTCVLIKAANQETELN